MGNRAVITTEKQRLGIYMHWNGGTDSVGIDMYAYLDKDNGDNGVYVIKDWKIVNRLHYSGVEQKGYDLEEVIMAIDEKQPERLYHDK